MHRQRKLYIVLRDEERERKRREEEERRRQEEERRRLEEEKRRQEEEKRRQEEEARRQAEKARKEAERQRKELEEKVIKFVTASVGISLFMCKWNLWLVFEWERIHFVQSYFRQV